MPLEDPGYWKALINMGLSRFFVLRSLHEKPTHGYALLDSLSTVHGGLLHPRLWDDLPDSERTLEGDYASVKSRRKADASARCMR